MKKILLATLLICGMFACKQGTTDKNNGPEKVKSDNRGAKDEVEENILRSADNMTNAFKSKDWATFTKYNHPNMLKMMGGEQGFEDLIETSMKDIPDSAVKSIGIDRIMQVVKTDKDIQCVVQQKMHMEIEGMSVNSTTYLVGESLDAGKTWTFFDASNSGAVDPKTIKPNLSPEIIVPEKRQDVKQL